MKTSHVYRDGLKKWGPGLVNFVPVIPFLFCLNLGRKILATRGPIISLALYIHDIHRGIREGVTGMGRKLFVGGCVNLQKWGVKHPEIVADDIF